MKSISIKVTGRVQGVFYRASTKSKADELGIKGIVRNERDGSVYIEAEAEAKPLEAFIDWCKHGPAHAKVEQVEIHPINRVDFKTFEIKR